MSKSSVHIFHRMREAMGTVYGDIGTSVLYTIMEITRETVRLKHGGESLGSPVTALEQGGPLLDRHEILGGLSLVYWALIFLTVKYDLLVMRADNHGEGGTFALWALLKGYTGKVIGLGLVGYLVVAAAGLLAADGIITPPISLLGAYEPLSAYTSWGESLPVLATLISLFVLFKPQWRGTSRVGGFFGWFMMLVWFPWIAIKAVPWVFRHPDVFEALNPIYGITFLTSFPSLGAFVILGVVVLAITGGEAKYADIGHFTRPGHPQVGDGQSLPPKDSGRRPVMFSWFFMVMPCLMFNYAGQTAYMLTNGVPPRGNTFYALTPRTGDPTLDSIVLAVDMAISTIAAFIASQALISGMFSIVKQAIALGFSPRFDVVYTSRHVAGQVYLPLVNWSMFAGCVVVTLMFRNAGNLAAAYGIAVTGTMGVTTLALGYVAHYRWRYPIWKVLIICIPLLVVDLFFFFSNLLKFVHGGYVPVAVAVALVSIMLTWQWGRRRLGEAFYAFGYREGKKIGWLCALRDMLDEVQISIEENLPHAKALIQGRRRLVESDRAFVFLCSRPVQSTEDYVPVALRTFLKKYGMLPSHLTLFHVEQLPIAEANPQDRYKVYPLGVDIIGVTARYGYMEEPNIRGALQQLQQAGQIHIPSERWIIEVGEEEIIVQEDLSRLHSLRVQFFRFLLRVSTPAHKFFGLGYDAGVSKEVIPVVFARDGVHVSLPELEISPEMKPPETV